MGVLENNGQLEFGKIIEIKHITDERCIFDYNYKFHKGGCFEINKNKYDFLQNLIINYCTELFYSLNLKHFARFDFFYCLDTKKIYFNEVNNLPCINIKSLFVRTFDYKYSFARLIDITINNVISSSKNEK
jgi:D-alanine-D-alanine ligase-like ATP-grasp enzyme